MPSLRCERALPGASTENYKRLPPRISPLPHLNRTPQGRVITAVSYSSPGTICFLSYRRQNDNSAYEASVATAPTASEAIAAATNLAASVITGFGGNTVNGYVMVGTRVNGNATPRPLQVTQSAGSLPSQGYVQVGAVSDASSGAAIFILKNRHAVPESARDRCRRDKRRWYELTTLLSAVGSRGRPLE